MISHTLIGQAASQENRAGMNTSYGYSLSKANVYKPCRWLKGGGLMAHTDNNLILLPMIIKAKQGSFLKVAEFPKLALKTWCIT